MTDEKHTSGAPAASAETDAVAGFRPVGGGGSDQGILVELTGAPQHLALRVHVGTDATVTEGGAAPAGFSVLEKDVGGTVGGGACAELREVTFAKRLTAQRARRAQLGGAAGGGRRGGGG